MTYEELLDKWIRKLGRDCTAGEIVHDLRQLERWIPIDKQKPIADHVLLTVKWDEDDYEVIVEDWGVGEYEIAEGMALPLVQSIHKHAVAWMPMPEPWRGERREDGKAD